LIKSDTLVGTGGEELQEVFKMRSAIFVDNDGEQSNDEVLLNGLVSTFPRKLEHKLEEFCVREVVSKLREKG